MRPDSGGELGKLSCPVWRRGCKGILGNCGGSACTCLGTWPPVVVDKGVAPPGVLPPERISCSALPARKTLLGVAPFMSGVLPRRSGRSARSPLEARLDAAGRHKGGSSCLPLRLGDNDRTTLPAADLSMPGSRTGNRALASGRCRMGGKVCSEPSGRLLLTSCRADCCCRDIKALTTSASEPSLLLKGAPEASAACLLPG
mmetsp:Transcript_65400/g.121949  ORF Transcript_65400/g.121949 Transcript_65400/m.121949 type:complete len:201 (+) Transcript_65400:124-726(+)